MEKRMQTECKECNDAMLRRKMDSPLPETRGVCLSEELTVATVRLLKT
ncbi:hypothetical protein HanRHA438_Chr11g0505001 [Helianthus annuus]|uniref:Uncharacterized protein n=1 Tax=Helianthus annuus TaxID=4232 RepID=A0A9K3N057_HELAN|nr:hypothetical protein HanXRQr2_Chr11g0492361 [Helianthus annuus]KAJ0501676.1 hypothetical protein HanHA300_Chr11g0403511 [Helianthus annuus]KAJ0509553.1 hypothetical protein HanIR_Chr11g0530131 [Helianthus annuus]KAJ0517590.1 hypothetical protein HanHA89_Chr11g0427101 [Helianthus annuus]KAJ0685603.1 hypothetical protein HanLR1_Chr11g0404571 [Helianthus annuus]